MWPTQNQEESLLTLQLTNLSTYASSLPLSNPGTFCTYFKVWTLAILYYQLSHIHGLFTIETSSNNFTWAGHESEVSHVVWNDLCSMWVSGSDDCTLRTWSVHKHGYLETTTTVTDTQVCDYCNFARSLHRWFVSWNLSSFYGYIFRFAYFFGWFCHQIEVMFRILIELSYQLNN